jgi:AcrR family transcriptional regulator
LATRAPRRRARLCEAALELYREHGYDGTAAAQIAARAGVTGRTYFRHFADKREVLFDGEAELAAILAAAVAAAPAGLAPLPVLVRAFAAAVPLPVLNRPVAEQRAQVIAVTPALQERAYAKTAALTDALANALADRGIACRLASPELPARRTLAVSLFAWPPPSVRACGISGSGSG